MDHPAFELIKKVRIQASAIGLQINKLPPGETVPTAVDKAHLALERCLGLLTRARKGLDSPAAKPRLTLVGDEE